MSDNGIITTIVLILDGLKCIIINTLFFFYFPVFICGCDDNNDEQSSNNVNGRRRSRSSSFSKKYGNSICSKQFHVIIIISLTLSMIYVYSTFILEELALHHDVCVYQCLSLECISLYI